MKARPQKEYRRDKLHQVPCAGLHSSGLAQSPARNTYELVQWMCCKLENRPEQNPGSLAITWRLATRRDLLRIGPAQQ